LENPNYGELIIAEQNATSDLSITVETSPRPDAIVGMWFRNGDYQSSGKTTTNRTNILVRADGTMIYKHRLDARNTSSLMKWNYVGKGVWKVEGDTEMQLSQGKLIWQPFGVFERISPDAKTE
jgi:hypothetical protein